mmetsp:Transcript_47839/g.119578  ORF Transcript_47839/g.119578 Transcript_47839/m.119578 type:complete len:332 (+) Transcript_47839:54-1049(+)|eukprot:CAMPEP_0173437640 /NCGR_PEP_ID=MMETSP1357-20121228/18133_1 /TAXON_ID=77926 /ORGANISM="Hemiselmis rufescens, Strain PCC563" /LENGTH=331 /DNA_ID=CAMNT_0014402833 /DNA_START=47 /DNA_END=1042 /DNA_ORIENTATION=+
MSRLAVITLACLAAAPLAEAFAPSLIRPLSPSPFSSHRTAPITPLGLPLAAASLRPSPPLSLRMSAKEGGLGLTHECSDGTKIKYDHIPAANPTIMYLPGLFQTRYDSKFNALQSWCKRNNYGYFVADYYGCGQSGGDKDKACISRWTQDTLTIIDEVIKGPVILCGSGVGGWVMLHVALQAPKDTVYGLVGVAADPDFTTDLVLPSLSEETLAKIKKEGSAMIKWGNNEYTMSQTFIDDAENNLVMKGGPSSLKVPCPVRLVQGLGDEEIPAERALTLCDVLATDDVVVSYTKLGNHVLDDEEDMRLVASHLGDLASRYFEYDLKSPQSG